jgi:predicted  nucleic acid-binding Zn-ribbon protein
MDELPILLELQGIHENLRVIQRDLTAFPPDVAKLDADLKAIAKRQESAAKELAEIKGKADSLESELKLAQRLEDHAKAAVKQSTHKVQYTAAIRELDERERQKTAAARPVKEASARISALEKELEELDARRTQLQSQFDELHQIFLSEHENQVAARDLHQARRIALEASLEPSTLVRFNKLLQQRQGRAVVPVENGNCGGCRTKLRIPLLSQLREHGPIPCEFCQRILYIPPKS